MGGSRVSILRDVFNMNIASMLHANFVNQLGNSPPKKNKTKTKQKNPQNKQTKQINK